MPALFARCGKYLSAIPVALAALPVHRSGSGLLLELAKGSNLVRVHTNSLSALLPIDVCFRHFALIVRESRRNDYRSGYAHREWYNPVSVSPIIHVCLKCTWKIFIRDS